ncbi:hypothetical protein, unlikely [Trypanosoma brucei brucei TREU927]|uniref:Secreted protein n=1 Tax=Trypanosoma brucei brucei (strain 927/4 GUTat10.1) TaxID=185431 RepID=Q38CR9_TRYB2|nr:hypothetical protein, unlikely [Trypanosoma brucei brucei TREU927]EAN77401.1 hypothetical protein, unlikely [Trypanosoma brucei brucei TREU927]
MGTNALICSLLFLFLRSCCGYLFGGRRSFCGSIPVKRCSNITSPPPPTPHTRFIRVKSSCFPALTRRDYWRSFFCSASNLHAPYWLVSPSTFY